MDVVNVTIDVEAGIATIRSVSAPAGTVVRIRLRDYDIDGCDRDGLNQDEDGRNCFETVTNYSESADWFGFV